MDQWNDGDDALPALAPLELWRIARAPEAERLSGADWDTLKLRYPHLVVKISPRAEGMRVAHALRLKRLPSPK